MRRQRVFRLTTTQVSVIFYRGSKNTTLKSLTRKNGNNISEEAIFIFVKTACKVFFKLKNVFFSLDFMSRIYKTRLFMILTIAQLSLHNTDALQSSVK